MSGGALAHALGRIRRVALLTLVAGLPLVFLWHVVNVPFDVPKLVLLVVCTSVAGAARLAEIALGSPSGGLRRAALPAACVAVPAVAAWAASDYRSWALLGMYGRFGGLVPILFTVAAGVLLADAFPGRLRALAWALSGAAAGVAFYALLQSAGLDPFDVPVVEYVTSTVGHSNYLGGFLAIALPVCLGLATSSRGIARYAAMGAAILAGLGILLSFSQGGWLAAAAGAVAFAGGVGARKRPRLRPLGWLAAGGLALAGAGLVVLSLVDPFNPVVPDTARARGLWWQAAAEMGAESPAFGRGPEVYAIEGPHHRVAADALAHDTTYADQPHSVPFAFFANHGVPGLAGFLLLVVWTLRKAWRAAADPLTAGFGAGAIAYFTQSLVTIDALVLTVPFWVCAAALAAAGARDAKPPEREAGAVRTGIALLLVATAGIAAAWAVSFLATDARARDAVAAFEEGRTTGAVEALEDVLRRRDNEGYRHLYGSLLGAVALREGAEGRPAIERMIEVFSVVDRFPDVRMLKSYAEGLHQWAVFDETLEVVALERFEQALALDEHSPTLRILTAEAHMTQGDADRAVDVLEVMLPVFEENPQYVHNQPAVYGALAIAYFLDGDEVSARGALERATDLEAGAPEECTVLVARELLRTGGSASSRAEYVDSSPGLLLCEPATLSLLPGYDPEAPG